VRAQTPICIEKGTMQDSYLKHVYPRANMVRKELEGDVLHGLWETDGCEMAAVPTQSFFRYKKLSSLNNDCSLRWLGRTIHSVNAGFATSIDTGTFCTSLISYVFDIHMLELKADGVLDQVWEEYHRWSTDQTCREDESPKSYGNDGSEEKSLSIQDLLGIFLFHLFLCTVSILMALCQHYLKKHPFCSFEENTSNRKDGNVDPVVDGDDNQDAQVPQNLDSPIIWGKAGRTLWNSEGVLAPVDASVTRMNQRNVGTNSKSGIWSVPDEVPAVLCVIAEDELRNSGLTITSHHESATVRKRPTARNRNPPTYVEEREEARANSDDDWEENTNS